MRLETILGLMVESECVSTPEIFFFLKRYQDAHLTRFSKQGEEDEGDKEEENVKYTDNIYHDEIILQCGSYQLMELCGGFDFKITINGKSLAEFKRKS